MLDCQHIRIQPPPTPAQRCQSHSNTHTSSKMDPAAAAGTERERERERARERENERERGGVNVVPRTCNPVPHPAPNPCHTHHNRAGSRGTSKKMDDNKPGGGKDVCKDQRHMPPTPTHPHTHTPTHPHITTPPLRRRPRSHHQHEHCCHNHVMVSE